MPKLKPTLRQLRVFEAVADELSFTRASEKLHLSQPAVSIQVKQLEEGVGLPLFEHIGRRISLTEAGRIMYRCSQTMRSVLQDAGEQIDELKGIRASDGVVHIGRHLFDRDWNLQGDRPRGLVQTNQVIV